MTKITKTNFGKRLAKYGALSLAIAGVADSTGQVVYTDVDPDFVGGMGDSFAIDFDGDGNDDVTILQSNNGNYELVQANAGAGGNGVANFDAMNAYVYAANIAEGAEIDDSLTFASFGSMCAGPGYTGSQFCGVGASFTGIEFSAAGNTHYGWVRVDVLDSSNFTVLDYGFNATPDTVIEAGDEGELGTDDQQFNGFTYFVDASSQLNLIAATEMSNITIFDIAGKQVISQKLSNINAQINLNSLNTGVYIANIAIDGASKSFKIVKK
jgi:hypothetical protein